MPTPVPVGTVGGGRAGQGGQGSRGLGVSTRRRYAEWCTRICRSVGQECSVYRECSEGCGRKDLERDGTWCSRLATLCAAQKSDRDSSVTVPCVALCSWPLCSLLPCAPACRKATANGRTGTSAVHTRAGPWIDTNVCSKACALWLVCASPIPAQGQERGGEEKVVCMVKRVRMRDRRRHRARGEREERERRERGEREERGGRGDTTSTIATATTAAATTTTTTTNTRGHTTYHAELAGRELRSREAGGSGNACHSARDHACDNA